ncbi:MAG: hypothetical protein GYA36_23385 [Veillonellaceae bacterium]|nr:hypothetical protein [Veillonellaceae bacterium]
MGKRFIAVSREDLISAYRETGTFKESAKVLGMGRGTFSRLWWDKVGIDPSQFKDGPPKIFRIGIVSDTHLGSRFQQLTHLKDFYRSARLNGCSCIVHAGDLTDGYTTAPSRRKNQFITSPDDMIDYVVGNYPNDLKTYFISGNHDEKFVKSLGIDVCREISRNRTDMEFIGSMYGGLEFGNIIISHGIGNFAEYSRVGTNKKLYSVLSRPPELIINGHTHTWDIVPRWAGAELLINTPCMVGGHIGTGGLNYRPSIGAMIVEFGDPGKHSLNCVYFNEIEDDF